MTDVILYFSIVSRVVVVLCYEQCCDSLLMGCGSIRFNTVRAIAAEKSAHIKKQQTETPPSNNTSTTSTVDESNDGSSNDTATPNTPAEVKKLRSRK